MDKKKALKRETCCDFIGTCDVVCDGLRLTFLKHQNTHLVAQLGRSGELHDGEVRFEPAAVCLRQTSLHKTAL